MSKLFPNPTLNVQTTPAPGPWILWERLRASGRREGLMCTLHPVNAPDDPAADLHLAVYPIDTGLDYVEWSSKALQMFWKAPALPEESRAVHCRIDLSRAEIDSDERTEYAREIVERLQKLAMPEVLDRFHYFFCAERNLRIGPAAALPEGWEIGDTIYFGHAFGTARIELVEEEGRTWAALDDHCPRPECACADTIIEVHRFVQKPLGMHDPLGAIVVAPDGNWDLKPLTREGLVLRAVWRRLQERWGDVPKELARRREIVRGVFGRMVLDAEQKRVPTPKLQSALPSEATARGPRTGRNDPCHCGSGRKFKRYCGRA